MLNKKSKLWLYSNAYYVCVYCFISLGIYYKLEIVGFSYLSFNSICLIVNMGK